MLRFNDIADRALEVDPDCDLELLQRAYVFSAKVHEGQERVSGEPYLIHPLEVAGVLLELRMDSVTVAAGLLHDTVEDGVTSLEEVQRLFGDEVAFLVEGLTKISKVEYSSARERQAESFRKMLVAMSKDIRILLIKLADRLHNMRTVTHLPEDKSRRIAQETLDIYVPLAHRLGIDWMRRELEDLAFRTLEPTAVADLEQKLKGGHIERDRYIEEVKGVLSAKLAEAGLAADVTGRLKDFSSIHAKMEKQGVTLEKIYDVIAFRIILDGPKESVYHALGPRARDLAAGAGALQGLRRAAQGQRLPVAAHDRDRPLRRAHGGAAPHARDAPERRARHRGALEVQGPRRPRQGRREVRLAAPADRAPGRARGPARVPRAGEGRPVLGRGLRLHAEGRRGEPAEGRDRARLRVRHPQPGGRALRRRARERHDAPAPPQAR